MIDPDSIIDALQDPATSYAVLDAVVTTVNLEDDTTLPIIYMRAEHIETKVELEMTFRLTSLMVRQLAIIWPKVIQRLQEAGEL